ncbi:hypothetical protein GIB67_033243 [Kingdonia uniflora]|uniref:DNA mismatch repair proteins mutS family domain-containing protein n=1 Tax=Kingdonia uniflora TaxID=39325 RepID=A0A7J7MPK9_9MAGN|nr:hypothetical protein GIB67_033243 [Kingdonia uniflora]
MLSSSPILSSSSISTFPNLSLRFKFKFKLKTRTKSISISNSSSSSSVVNDSLRVLEWDKVCDSVASFAGTSLGRQATKAQLWSLNQSFVESKRLLAETNAAVEMIKYGGSGGMDFSGIDVALVESAIGRASRGSAVYGNEALAIVSFLLFCQALQYNVKAAINEGADWYNRFMPLTEVIMELVVNQSLVKSIQQVVDEEGFVRDSAVRLLLLAFRFQLRSALHFKSLQLLILVRSSDLKRSRDQVRVLERKEVSNIDGRWCIKSGFNQVTTFKGLLLSSGSGEGSLVEPLSAVPLNDELQQVRSLVANAEEEVLLRLTEKIRTALDDIHNSLKAIVQLDVVIARAKYSLSFGGTVPDLFSTDNKDGFSTGSSHPTQLEWTLYLPNSYHPLLLQRHRKNLLKAKKDVSNAIAEIRRRKFQGETVRLKETPDVHLESSEMQVAKVEEAHPIPVDFFVGTKTRVLVITGPNTGGKTICLKTVGLAAMMAKSGLYVLSSEPVRIPWFDFVLADIGDEQSLSQSLSTFSGHLRQISAILKQSTSKSLVLLDEVGAGTNPLEGSALGMSLLESFAESGALLTIATTHHGELKTLKYSNDAFENACMEFDDVNLKPTYKILWGVPGRSNAINIAERLGLPNTVVNDARELYGTASAEINEVIVDMERFKQDFQKHIQESQHYLNLSRELHENLLAAQQRITEHGITQRYKKAREISEAATTARSTLHKKLREFRASAATLPSQRMTIVNNPRGTTEKLQHTSTKVESSKQSSSEKRIILPKVGDVVHVSSIGKKATVIKVEASKEEVIVQANNMKLRMKLSDIQT